MVPKSNDSDVKQEIREQKMLEVENKKRKEKKTKRENENSKEGDFKFADTENCEI